MSSFLVDQQNVEAGLFNAHKSLDGDISHDYVDKEQFIGLIVHHDEFLFPLAHVEEIIMPPKLTFVPYSRRQIEGVINLRGTIIPVINLRRILGHPRTGFSSETRIIILHNEGLRIGIIVDRITLVQALLPEEISQEGLQNFQRTAEILAGLSVKQEKVKGILDMMKIFSLVMAEEES